MMLRIPSKHNVLLLVVLCVLVQPVSYLVDQNLCYGRGLSSLYIIEKVIHAYYKRLQIEMFVR